MSTDEKKKRIKKQKPKKKGTFSTILVVVIMIVGLSVLLYPTVSDYWNRLHQSKAIMNYDSVVENMDETDYETLMAEAEQYNEHLKQLTYPFTQHEELQGEYNSVLNVAGNGIIGYVAIPSIGVELPIYHGTSNEVLNKAAGHMEGSTLPIGGDTTHAVISAHRGLPSAKLFTDLDDVNVGDEFYVTVLKQTLTYVVDQILIVEPDQLDALNLVEGGDYVTLITCTPYGVNTHRLLVRGHRVETEHGDVHVHADAFKVPPYVVIPMVAIPTLILVLILMLIMTRDRARHDLYDNEITLQDLKEEERLEAEKLAKKKSKKLKKNGK